MASHYRLRHRPGSSEAQGTRVYRPVSGALAAFVLWSQAACSPSVLDPQVQADPELQRIEVSPAAATVDVGGTVQISALAFDQHGNDLTYGNLDFRWSSTHAQHVEVDQTGQTVTVRGLQEYVNAGTTGVTDVEVRIQGRSQPVGRARITVNPVDNIQVTPSPITLDVGATVSISADATVSTGASVTVPTTWSVDDAAVASVTGTSSSNVATITGLAPGTTILRAVAGTKESGPVTVTVAEAPPEPGIIHGVLYDVDGTTALDSVNLSMGVVNPPPGSPTFRTKTGRQDPGPVPAGGYRFEVSAGRYVVFTVGVLGSRWVSTPGDTAVVLSGDSTGMDLNVRRGYHLDMLGTSLGEVQAAAGSSIDLTVGYRTWCRDLGPLCSPALAIGVDGTPLAVHRFGQPGVYPGQMDESLAIPITVPASGGTIYAMLVTTSTAEGIQAGLDQYSSVWERNLQATMLIPIGTLTVN